MCHPFLNRFVRYDALLRGWCVAYVGEGRRVIMYTSGKDVRTGGSRSGSGSCPIVSLDTDGVELSRPDIDKSLTDWRTRCF
jgi:hypothetical protein